MHLCKSLLQRNWYNHCCAVIRQLSIYMYCTRTWYLSDLKSQKRQKINHLCPSSKRSLRAFFSAFWHLAQNITNKSNGTMMEGSSSNGSATAIENGSEDSTPLIRRSGGGGSGSIGGIAAGMPVNLERLGIV